ncbi:MAG TPA: hypothetical protein VIL46_05245 [Gemmataceae bacterium]
MEQQTYDALDRAIAAGGEKLAASAVEPGRGAKALLARMCDEGYLRKEGTRYSVTPDGRAAWEEAAPPERVREVRERPLAEFLALVERKGGKPLSAKEAGRFPEEVLREARDRNLVREGEKPRVYHLLPAGRALLLERLPLSEQVAALRELGADLEARWEAVGKKLREDLQALLGQGDAEANRAVDSLQETASRAVAQLEGALGELEATPRWIGIARRALEAVRETAAPALRYIEERATEWGEIEEQVRAMLLTQRAELEAFKAAYERIKDRESAPAGPRGEEGRTAAPEAEQEPGAAAENSCGAAPTA